MSNENNNINKDVANSLSSVTDYTSKGTNAILDTANQINNWYAEQLSKISEAEIPSSRLETNVDNAKEVLEPKEEQTSTKIETKVDEYNEIQTNQRNNKRIINNSNRIKTQLNSNENTINDIKTIKENNSVDGKANKLTNNKNVIEKNQNKIPQRISTAIKGVKSLNSISTKAIKTGRTINTGLNDNSIKSFENTSTRLNNKALKKVGNKATSKVKKKIASGTTNILVKLTKALAKIMLNISKMIISMIPSIAPAVFIIIIIVCFCSFFGFGMNDETMKKYEEYMISTQNSYDSITVAAYNDGKVVEGTIEGKGMINWRASMSIIQMLNGELGYDNAEKELLNEFKEANLYEKITDVTYTYEKTIEETDSKGNVTTKKETVTETKKVVENPSLDDYINWCNDNFNVINRYKKKKKIEYDSNQTSFTESEVEQIRLLYSSNSFFDLFSEEFRTTYAYSYVNINDEQIQAIYDEFLKNAGTRYLMDHSNLKYDECMDYYDCSSWVIHVLGHTGIKIIPNTGAQGIYKYHCNPINVNDRKAGDLIFLKDTYDTGEPGSISHIGIYMGELTINGETAEWVIDTGSNPSGVRIRKYNNGWWNGPNFYGFARLK